MLAPKAKYQRGAEGEAGITLRVVVRVAEPYGSILESSLECDGIEKTGGEPAGERFPVKE